MLDLVALSIYKQKSTPHPTPPSFLLLAAVIFYSEGRYVCFCLITNEEQKSKLVPDVEELAEAGALLVCINSVS